VNPLERQDQLLQLDHLRLRQLATTLNYILVLTLPLHNQIC
jgi:hypothetical protein